MTYTAVFTLVIQPFRGNILEMVLPTIKEKVFAMLIAFALTLLRKTEVGFGFFIFNDGCKRCKKKYLSISTIERILARLSVTLRFLSLLSVARPACKHCNTETIYICRSLRFKNSYLKLTAQSHAVQNSATKTRYLRI